MKLMAIERCFQIVFGTKLVTHQKRIGLQFFSNEKIGFVFSYLLNAHPFSSSFGSFFLT